MSNYRNFHKDIIKRSKINLDNYNGKFEVTMLLNTLYMTLLHPIEKRSKFGINVEELADYLFNNGICNACTNTYNADDVLRHLRNGLAHLNIKVAEESENIENIEIYLTKHYNNKKIKVENGYICLFSFTIAQLREFTNLVIDDAIRALEEKENRNAR